MTVDIQPRDALAARHAPGSETRAGEKQCDLCGGARFEQVSQRDRRGRPLATCVCRTCGLVVHARVPSAAELDDYYRREYRRDYHGETVPSARRVMRAWNNAERIYRQLTPHLHAGEEVLDLGAGIGCAAKLFEQRGFRASGLEPNEGFLGYSRDVLHAPVRHGVLGDLPRQPQADVVLLIHVIEHFRSPREALEHIRALLKPGGRLYVECPNLAVPFAPPGKLFHAAHIHNFTPETLQMLAEWCGLRLVKRFGPPDDPNLQMLFSAASSTRRYVNPESYFRTRQALARYSALSYCLRRRYLKARFHKLVGYAREHLTARSFVRRLIERCGDSAAQRGAAARAA